MKGNITIAVVLIGLFFGSGNTFAQLGKNGAKTITTTVTNSNEYTTLTADAASGNTALSVASSTLNSGGNFSAALDTGDLIMIMQMQGATLNSATDSTWGSVTNYNNCGNYEFAEVLSAPNTSTINLNCGLQNNYSAAGRVQVIRVPRYSSVTVNSGGDVSCPAWNGATGGVLAIEVSGNTVINGTGQINVSGTGFRGAVLINNSSIYGALNYVWSGLNYGAEKGEGIGGYQTDYNTYGGEYCKGAGANGGGGGNAHNGGGGGGANGGNPAAWSGKGNPDISNASWINAWNLEYNGFANSSSSGGGKGGYTFSSSNQNALVVGPDNALWGGDNRENNGGLGGRPLDYTTGRIFLGGGGGAGEENDNAGGAGGNGGGLVYLVNYGTVSGSGQILANGSNGFNTTNSGIDGGIDAAGGAGGGGTIILNSTGAISGISATANGGNGGSQSVSVFDADEAEGPGGGGGGGYIAISNGSITQTTNGGANGTTNSAALTEFPANGATKGGAGTNNISISNFSLSASNVTACYGSAANLSVTLNGSLPGGTTIYWYDSPFGGTTLNSGTTYTTPILTANATYYVGACPGTYRLPVAVTVDSVASNFTFSNACYGTPTVFSSVSSYSSGGTINQWNWDFGDGSGTSSQPNPSYAYFSSGSYPVILSVTDNMGCSAHLTQPVNVATAPSVSFAAIKTTGCDSLSVQFTNATTNGLSYHWKFGDGDSSSLQTPLHDYLSPGAYKVILSSTSSGGCVSADTIVNMITIGQTPVAAFNSVSSCSSSIVQFNDASTGAPTSWSWNFGDGSGTSSQQNVSYGYASNGNYTVTLVATGSYGCSDTISKSVSANTSPVVNFSSINTAGCDSLSAQFTNSTTNAQSYHWSFGDGDTSAQQTPLHMYLSPGNYTVVLVASNSGCSATDSIVNLITVNKTPVANFSFAADCGSKSVQLSDSSTGPITSWAWNFGDGIGTSGDQDPFYIYSADTTYNITLVVTGGGGCADSLTQAVTFTTPPSVNFTANYATGCDSLTVTFINSTSNAVSYAWDFGDGDTSTEANPAHLYLSPGIYNVTLTAVSPGGCSIAQSVINMITVDSVPVIPTISQAGDSLISSPAATYQWYFNSTLINGAVKQSYVATVDGDYSVVVTNSYACSSTSSVIHVVLNGVTNFVDGTAATFYPNPVSDYLQINFSDLSKTPAKAELTDVLGKVVWEQSISITSSENVILDMRNMCKNVYFLTLYYSDKKTVSRIMKE